MPIRSKDSKSGKKLLTNREEPYRIKRGELGNIYILETLKKDSAEQSNGEYLKEYYPNIWINTGQPICSIDSSNSWYQEGIDSGGKINPEG